MQIIQLNMEGEIFVMETKKKKQMPNSIVIIFMVIIFSCILTWIIPAGQYARYVNDMGREVVDPLNFSYIEQTPVSLLEIPSYIVSGFRKQIDILLLILFSGGVFQIINGSGALQSLVAKGVKKYSDKSWIFITLFSLMFCLLCTVKSVNTWIPFAPIFVLMATSMGFDPIVGVGIILLGGAVGFSTGTLMGSTTLLAQQLAGLPAYSGIGYRAFCLVVFYIFTDIYLVRYALKVKKDPTKSPMYDLMKESGTETQASLDSFGPMTKTKWLVFAVLVGTLVTMVAGAMNLDWGFGELAAGWIWCAIALCVVMKKSPSETVSEFIKGARGMLFAGFIICTANAIAQIMTAGNILDTVVHALAFVLNMVPTILQGPAMYILNLAMNPFITSGSGHASMIMPILTPLADLIGMTRQTVILADNFGDGFGNYVVPTSSALMGILSAGNVPYDRWMKFMWKLFLIWIAVGSVLMIIAQIIKLGPA